jgi:hypothetical protein
MVHDIRHFHLHRSWQENAQDAASVPDLIFMEFQTVAKGPRGPVAWNIILGAVLSYQGDLATNNVQGGAP